MHSYSKRWNINYCIISPFKHSSDIIYNIHSGKIPISYPVFITYGIFKLTDHYNKMDKRVTIACSKCIL